MGTRLSIDLMRVSVILLLVATALLLLLRVALPSFRNGREAPSQESTP